MNDKSNPRGGRPEGVKAWTDHVKELGTGLLSNDVNSWMTGVNTNVEGKQTRIIARYSGSAPAYREQCNQVAANGYQGTVAGIIVKTKPAGDAWACRACSN